ncbi:hypothetical protein HNO88_002561 [Novosphingobium chloroacetimidivorans]|uniref:Uncharacterized protein n=1 Tax=Novosphingobium chloroacetimidivorans TaxID=1428314 RepID=A0A7W7KAH7_9SPHN|nr:hypothetical protein [Novosphingobium chloroacetimidivorans]MBB4859232.1 hypothetical protein [Novosphingobium chloroacetimidivorans]
MIQTIIVSVALTFAGGVGTPAAEMAARLAWVQEVKSLLPFTKVADRPAAFRNYAATLVDIGLCDTAKELLRSHTSFDAELVSTVMDHATSLGEARCAASLAQLVLSRLTSSTSRSPLRLAELQMAAGAAIQVGGNRSLGATVISSAEASLQADKSASTLTSDQASTKTLWIARAGILDIYSGTPYYAPTLAQYGQELASGLSRSKTYLPLPMIRGFAMRFGASDRADLVELVASKLWPADRQEIVHAASLARNPEMGETLGNKPKPRCGQSLGSLASQPRSSERREGFERIVDLTVQSGRAAVAARCSTPR